MTNASLLLVTFGPVQGFIAAGRRTSDLWAGSALLSHLAAQAVAAVQSEVGPDAFLFPARRADASQDESLPNRFLVRVPTGRAAELARRAETAVREEMRLVARHGLLKAGIDAPLHDDALALAERYLEVAWAAVPLDADAGLLTDGAALDETARAYRLVEMLAGGRKALRNFDGAQATEASEAWPDGEGGVRCTLLPELPALGPGEPGRSAAFWAGIAESSAGRIRASERLSAVALAKRFFPSYRRQADTDQETEAFPSTSSFAAADFYADVFGAQDDRVRAAAEGFEAAAAALPGAVRTRYTEASVPAVERAAGAQRIGQLHRRSGRLVVGDPLDARVVERETGQTVSKAELDDFNGKRRSLLAAAQAAGIAPPSRYYAVLVLDGDKMGEWLSGTRAPGAFGGATGAARHQEISSRLRAFSAERVPEIVETQYAGRLVYGGGDDVVALFSFRTALPAVLAIEAAFREAFHADATASAGLVYAHHLTPLQQVLAAARAAEQRAKTRVRRAPSARAGESRNQLALTALKRSGDPAEVVLDWGAVPALQAFAEQTRGRVVARGYAYDLAEALRRFRGPDTRNPATGRFETPPVPDDLRPAFEAEALRLFERRAEGLPRGDGRPAAVRAAFQASAGALLQALPPADAVAALHVAQFLGRGGDR